MGDWLERNRGYILVTLINLALVGGLAFWLKRPDPAPLEMVLPDPTPAPSPTSPATPPPMRIYVTGAVAHPDVYQLPAGCIVKEAIQAAGGATGEADLVHVNLAQELHDQQQLYVPRMGEADAPPPVIGRQAEPDQPSPGGATAGKININTATAEELDALPGIGPSFAQRIIEYRETNGAFKSIEDIVLVRGIGEATLAKIKDLITVE
jgi:competence protein ComEA